MLSRRKTLIAGIALVLGLLIGMGTYLAGAQTAAADKLRQDFKQRATVSGQLTSGALLASTGVNRAYARKVFSADGSSLQTAVDEAQKEDDDARIVIFGGDGMVLATYPRTLRYKIKNLSSAPEIRRALRGLVGLSDVFATPNGPAVMLAVPFSTTSGARRVWSVSLPAEMVAVFGRAYLSGALGVPGGRAFIIDSRGIVLASSAGEHLGKPLPDHALATALRKGRSGILEEDYYASAGITATSWRVVFAAREDALLAPIDSTRRVAWQLFGGFVLAMLALIALAASALNRSARLAHERLHDTLTGLPNRAFVIERTEGALTTLNQRGGHLGVLFIDLDRFKPINDTHGHAMGDALLAMVASRLLATVRSNDIVSRFGGDEFLVLCSHLDDEFHAAQIAQRIQAALAQPFVLRGFSVSIGCSIGVATQSVAENVDAATLIHHADLAMYQAKRHGRSCVEAFDPRLTPAPA